MGLIKKSITHISTFFIGILVIGTLFFLGSDVVVPPPSNAIVMLKHNSQTYLAPPCINKNFNIQNNSNFSKSTLKEAKELNYKSDNCSEHALYSSRSTIIHYTLEPLKIIKPLNRWDKDGNWLY
jgi:hypothetical protein